MLCDGQMSLELVPEGNRGEKKTHITCTYLRMICLCNLQQMTQPRSHWLYPKATTYMKQLNNHQSQVSTFKVPNNKLNSQTEPQRESKMIEIRYFLLFHCLFMLTPVIDDYVVVF